MNTLFLMSGPSLEEAPLTFLIIAITCFTSYKVMDHPGEKQKFIFHPYGMKRSKEWFRFLTHGLIHGSWMHLGLNMFVMYMFGATVEQYYRLEFGALGPVLFIALYASGLIMASVYSYFKHKDNPSYRALGASGAIGSIVFASILFQPTAGIGILLISDITGFYLPAFIFGILYLSYSAYMSKKGTDNIGHDAHYWGSVWGFVFTCILAPHVFFSCLNQIKFYLGLG